MCFPGCESVYWGIPTKQGKDAARDVDSATRRRWKIGNRMVRKKKAGLIVRRTCCVRNTAELEGRRARAVNVVMVGSNK